MSSRGVTYIAYGEPARAECAASIASLRGHYSGEIAVIAEERISGARWHVRQAPMDQGARWFKVNLDWLSPFDTTLYLDSDTRVHGSIEPLFAVLEDGWDMVITPSDHQGDGILWHVGSEEREATLDAVGLTPIQYQCGVLGFRKSPQIIDFFSAWQAEWERYGDQDQGAFLRALYQKPVRLWVAGRVFNGGAVIQHLFGKLRETVV